MDQFSNPKPLSERQWLINTSAQQIAELSEQRWQKIKIITLSRIILKNSQKISSSYDQFVQLYKIICHQALKITLHNKKYNILVKILNHLGQNLTKSIPSKTQISNERKLIRNNCNAKQIEMTTEGIQDKKTNELKEHLQIFGQQYSIQLEEKDKKIAALTQDLQKIKQILTETQNQFSKLKEIQQNQIQQKYIFQNGKLYPQNYKEEEYYQGNSYNFSQPDLSEDQRNQDEQDEQEDNSEREYENNDSERENENNDAEKEDKKYDAKKEDYNK